jgi:starch phosphorylase
MHLATGLAMQINVETGIELLRQLALDLRWSWNHSTDELWRRLEPDLWLRTHNPWVVLQTVSPQRLATLLHDPAFRARIEAGAAQTRRDRGLVPAGVRAC